MKFSKKVKLFKTKKDFFFFVFICSFIFSFNLVNEFGNYKHLTSYKTVVVKVSVKKAYIKTKHQKTYKVLKLQTDQHFTFYTIANKNLQVDVNDRLEMILWVQKLNFYDYLSGTFLFSKILNIEKEKSLKQILNQKISLQHTDENVTKIYEALFSATPLSKELQTNFSNLGISHLLAISGFHLSVLVGVLFFIFKPFYRFFQTKFFPYRSYKVDSFIFISIILFFYTYFLDYPPSVLRAFSMLIVGFILYNRAIEMITTQTLFVTVLLLLAFFPRIVFSLGFWLSVSGVFYIFIFLKYFKNLKIIMQFFIVPVYVYISMLPISIFLFHNFSEFHIFSILESIIFTLFYPLSIFLHLVGYGNLFDTQLQYLIMLGEYHIFVPFQKELIYTYLTISILSICDKKFFWLSLLFGIFVLVYCLKLLHSPLNISFHIFGF